MIVSRHSHRSTYLSGGNNDNVACHCYARVRKDGEKRSGKIRLAFTGLAQNNFLQRGGKNQEKQAHDGGDEKRSIKHQAPSTKHQAPSTKHQSIIQ